MATYINTGNTPPYQRFAEFVAVPAAVIFLLSFVIWLLTSVFAPDLTVLRYPLKDATDFLCQACIVALAASQGLGIILAGTLLGIGRAANTILEAGTHEVDSNISANGDHEPAAVRRKASGGTVVIAFPVSRLQRKLASAPIESPFNAA